MVYDFLFDTVLARMDPEHAHEQVLALIRATTLPLSALPAPAAGGVEVMGLTFPHRFGLAAGFDKNATVVPGLLAMGFGHVEVGTVTAQAQPGNPRPRLARLVEDRAIVNRMGFNNDGAAVVASRLHRLRSSRRYARSVIGVNIGKSKVTPLDGAVQDYAESTRLLAPMASYLTINVSSPNTPGLRDLQSVDALRPILTEVKRIADRTRHPHARRDGVPVVVKIAPDLADEDILAVADLAVECGLDGLNATNTTIARPDRLRSAPTTVEAAGAGGLSGPILADRAGEVLRLVRGRVGDSLALFGVGGVTTPADVRSRLDAGAQLVQGYTGFIYEGPLWARRLRSQAR